MYDRIRYYIKKPGTGRASFSILKDVVKTDGTRKTSVLKDERIDSINQLFKEKLKDLTICELELKFIIKELYQEIDRQRGTHTFNDDNRRILDTYWKQKYEHKDNIDLSSAKNELSRAIEALGPLSLISTDRDTLQKTINKTFKGNKQRRIVSSINQLLRYSGRDIQLNLAKKERTRVRHLRPTEFEKVIKYVQDETYKLFFKACFASGGRTGEVFAMIPDNLEIDVMFIETQLDRDEVERDTKNRRERHTVINPDYVTDFKKWLNLADTKKTSIRNEKHSDILRDACQKAFPEEPKKHCTVKDLRHSYAIWLLSKGVSLSLVAQSLGNSNQVCEENYAGFVLAPDSIQAIKSILQKDKTR